MILEPVFPGSRLFVQILRRFSYVLPKSCDYTITTFRNSEQLLVGSLHNSSCPRTTCWWSCWLWRRRTSQSQILWTRRSTCQKDGWFHPVQRFWWIRNFVLALLRCSVQLYLAPAEVTGSSRFRESVSTAIAAAAQTGELHKITPRWLLSRNFKLSYLCRRLPYVSDFFFGRSGGCSLLFGINFICGTRGHLI